MPTEVVLPANPQSGPHARKVLIETLEAWGQDALQFAASLALSELIANSILHAKTDIVLRLHRTQHGVLIEVADRSPRIPQPRRYAADATTGRGLALIDAVCQAWGVQPTSEGKIVWCEVTEASAIRNFPSEEAHLDGVPDLDEFPDLDTGHAGDREVTPKSRTAVGRRRIHPAAPAAAA